MQTQLFNLGISDNPKNILIASDLTPNKSKKMREVLTKRWKVFV